MTPSCTRNRQVSTWHARNPATAAESASRSMFLSMMVSVPPTCLFIVIARASGRSSTPGAGVEQRLPELRSTGWPAFAGHDNSESSKQFQAGRQRQTAGEVLHLVLHHGLGLATRIAV